MATYSRSQSSTTTAEFSTSSLLSSKTIADILVKSMENTNDENKTEDEKLKDAITQAINDSDLLKDKTKDKNDKDLNNLLKDKQNTDKELADLLKNKKNDDKELSGLLKNNKEKSSAGKVLGLGAIGATLGAILKSKSIGQAADNVVSGAGKAAGGLISGVGNLGGSAIAGIGKLFGPVGGVIGKFVGAAVALPFKAVGGVITKAIGALGSLLSMPLKEMVTKAGLILAVGTQVFVFLEGLIAKFKADSDLRAIDFAAKIKSFVSVIPDRIKLSLEQVLSKVRIMGKPIFGSLSKDEEKQLKSLEKDKDIKAYNKAMKGVDNADKTLNTMANQMGAGGINATDYDLNSEEGRAAYKAAVITAAKQSHIENGMPELNEDYANAEIDKWLANRDKERALAEEKVKGLKIDEEKLSTYLDLKDRSKQALTADYFAKEQEKLKDKQQEKYDDYVKQGLKKEVEKGDFTAYEAERAKSKFGWGTQVDAVLSDYKTEHGSNYNFAPATAAEKFLENQYKAWTNAWKDMLSHTLQNTVGVNVNVNQETSRSNPV